MHELVEMRAIAERLELPFDEYVNMVPTIYGGAETLPSQSVEYLRKRKVFTGCNAGHTFFHVDPHGNASIRKVGRDPRISLMDEEVESLRRLGGIADGLLLRQGECTGCSLKKFGDQDKRHRGEVMQLTDCAVADTFPAFAGELGADGFAFLYQRIKAGLSDGPILVRVEDRRIVGAVGPMGTLLDSTGLSTLGFVCSREVLLQQAEPASARPSGHR